MIPRALAVCVVAAMLTIGSSAWGADIAALRKKLLTASDFRVRAQAALKLGRSGNKKAVAALCKGLGDQRDTVRAASAAGLGKLALGGKKCIETQLKKEQASNVKKMLKKALRLVNDGLSGPGLSSRSKVYLAIGSIKNETGRKEAVGVLRGALFGAAQKKSGYVMAPKGEKAKQARRRLGKFPNVFGYKLVPAVRSTYDGRGLSVQVDINILNYPDNSPAGSLQRILGVPDIHEENAEKEDELIRTVTASLVEQFAKMVTQSSH